MTDPADETLQRPVPDEQHAPVPASEAPTGRLPTPRAMRSWARRLPRPDRRWADPAIAAGLGASIVAITFVAGAGTQLGPRTGVEIAALLVGVALVVAAVLMRRHGAVWGAGALGAFAAFYLFTAWSVTWSVVPDVSWQEANRTLAYLAVFAGGVAAARLAHERWRPVLYGLAGGLAVVAVWGLATKVFPGTLNADDTLGRLREPFGYWNAVGLSGAIGVLCSLWIGARREARPAEQVAAVPLVALFTTVTLLSYSRGALLALAAGLALWLVLVPLRLRSVAIGIAGAAIAAAVFGFALTQDALVREGSTLAERSDAGTLLGIVLIAALGLAIAAGLALPRFRERVGLKEAERPRAGRLVAGAAGATLLVGAVAFMATGGGPGERLSNLTSETAQVETTDPGRLASTGNIRGAYWRDAGRVWSEHRLVGAGAGAYDTVRLRHRQTDLPVRRAHGFGPQTLADLGLIGIALVLLLLGAWAAAARRPIGAIRSAGRSVAPEGTGMVALGAVVVAFGVHSAVDWTWFVPALTMPALFVAGWLAGRGPLDPPAAGSRMNGSGDSEATVQADGAPGSTPQPADRAETELGRRMRITATLTIAGLVALVGLYSLLQPNRAANASDEALSLSAAGEVPAATARAEEAVDIDPLSAEALLARAAVAEDAGELDVAEARLAEAVQLQPGNPETWSALGDFRLNVTQDFEGAEEVLAGALFLDPRSERLKTLYTQSVRALTFEGTGGTAG